MQRADRVRARMEELGVDALLLSLGADLPWLTGYTAMPLERLTMLVLPADGDATLVIPRLEAPRVEPRPGASFAIHPWDETDDPVALVAALVGSRRRLALSDRTWATFVLRLQTALPDATWSTASAVTSPLRAIKDPDEIDALRRAAEAADRVAAQLLKGDIALIGRTEADVSRDIGERLVGEGHQHVNFAIVGSGPNSASPHHEPGARVIGPGEAVVCDFGGTYDGYCSDITRTVFTGGRAGAAAPPPEFVEVYEVVRAAQAAGVRAATTGTACEAVDGTARSRIADAGYGEFFIHRVGHGIGMTTHEPPYLVAGEERPIEAGMCFSIEPGIYLPGRFGVRIEDIVVATEDGAHRLNNSSRELHLVR